MSSVAVRPPRFLGEIVPTREQTTQERIQEALGAGWIIEPTDSGFVAKAPAVEYVAEKDTRTKMIRRGQEYRKSSYIPQEYTISPSGEVLTETTRGIFTSDTSKRGYTQEPFVSSFTDYPRQFQETFGTRDMKSGRETVRTTSRTEAGMRKDFRIINQDTKEYERLKRTEEQAKLIRDEGFLVRRTERYAVAGMSEPQREKYYKLKAQQRSAELSMEAKAKRVARDATWQFQQELQAESSKYVRDIVQKQGKIEEQKSAPTFQMYEPVEKTSEPQFRFDIATPSRTTRTDMGDKPFLIGGKLAPGVLREAEKPSGFGVTNRIQDVLSFKSSRARAQGREGAGYGYALAEFGASVPIGAVKLGYSLLPQNLPETVGNMFNPESYRQAGQELTTRPAKFAGETTGALLASYGISKGYQAVKTKYEAFKTQRQGPSSESSASSKGKEFQGRLNENGIDIVNKEELNFLKTKEGKGEKVSTVFGSKKVLTEEGKVINTPSIQKLRDEIPGNPSKIGKGFFREEITETRGVTSARTVAETGAIKVRGDIETTLRKPQIIATSKWLPGDARRVVVQNGIPYVEDMWGGKFRPFNPQEFSLETVYEGGLQPSQQTAVSNLRMNYVKDISTPFGDISINTRQPGVQSRLYPSEIVIVRKPGTYPSPALSSPRSVVPSGSVIDMTPKDSLVGAESQSVILEANPAPQKYATAGEVIEGTLKVYPKYQSSKAVPSDSSIASFQTPQQTVPTSYLKMRGFAEAGLLTFPKAEAIQESKVSPVQVGILKSELVKQPSLVQEPKTDVLVFSESISSLRKEARAESVAITYPVNVLQTENILRAETVTETKQVQRLQTDLFTETIQETTPVTRKSMKVDVVPGPVPPDKVFSFKTEGEKKQSGKYEVQVREKGIFKTISVASSPQEAFKFGQRKVEQTASASLRIKNMGGTGDVLSIGRSILPKKSFYESKKEPGVFIQRREKRISSPGEKREITFKGLMVKKSRSIFG